MKAILVSKDRVRLDVCLKMEECFAANHDGVAADATAVGHAKRRSHRRGRAPGGGALSRLLVAFLLLRSAPDPDDRVPFDFEEEDHLGGWSTLEIPGERKEPPARLELSSEHAASGKQCLKIAFAGKWWPTLTTNQLFSDCGLSLPGEEAP
jgi:hypothetical protein